MDYINISNIKRRIHINDSPYSCYLLKSEISNKTYFGYTVNITRRLRQHNGEITGGAKKTKIGRPWKLMLYITGFPDSKRALQFEWKVNHPRFKKYKYENRIIYINSLIDQFHTNNNYRLITFPRFA